MHPVFADVFGGYDILIVLIVVALVFGGSQLPKLARSLGSAHSEFKKGVAEGAGGLTEDPPKDTGPAPSPSSTDSTP